MRHRVTKLSRILLYQILSVTVFIFGMTNAANAKNLIYENNWAYLADTVMGGVSKGGAEFAAGALRLIGQVSTANNGGFIQVRTRIDPSETSDKTGIRIKVKGNGEIYYLHIRNASARLPWHYYTASFQTNEKWKDIAIPFEE